MLHRKMLGGIFQGEKEAKHIKTTIHLILRFCLGGVGRGGIPVLKFENFNFFKLEDFNLYFWHVSRMAYI